MPKRIEWPMAVRRYLIASLVLNLVWEVLQLPLYTLWQTGTYQQQAFAVLHCTIGDIMIAGLTLLIALSLLAQPEWPQLGAGRIWLATLLLGIGYTIYSEWINVTERANWAYSEWMPIVPLIGVGVSPLLQWLIVPTLAYRFALGRWLSLDRL